jgi:hypothetical protein
MEIVAKIWALQRKKNVENKSFFPIFKSFPRHGIVPIIGAIPYKYTLDVCRNETFILNLLGKNMLHKSRNTK